MSAFQGSTAQSALSSGCCPHVGHTVLIALIQCCGSRGLVSSFRGQEGLKNTDPIAAAHPAISASWIWPHRKWPFSSIGGQVQISQVGRGLICWALFTVFAAQGRCDQPSSCCYCPERDLMVPPGLARSHLAFT